VVDDQEENVYLLRVLLSSQDYEVIEAHSGEEALERLEEQPCDLVLLDVVMPGMDGYEVCQTIRDRENLRHIPVILLTAKRDVESKVRGLDIGASDYITKPFEREEVMARIRSLLTIEGLREKLVKAERLAAIGELIVTLNHEINTPLSVISGNAELLAGRMKNAPEEVQEKIRAIREECRHIAEILLKVRKLKQAAPKTYIQDTRMIDIDFSEEPDLEGDLDG